jgi:hypothetical protein
VKGELHAMISGMKQRGKTRRVHGFPAHQTWSWLSGSSNVVMAFRLIKCGHGFPAHQTCSWLSGSSKCGLQNIEKK